MLSINPMFRLLIAVLIIVAATPATPAQAATDEALELTTEIAQQRYCVGDAELDGVSFVLRIRYRNTGTQPLILYKGSTDVYGIVVRKTADGSVESDLEPHVLWSSDKPWTVDSASLNSLFVVLRPTETYEAVTTARVFVTRDDTRLIAGSVQSGDHYLQVTIPTWPGSKDLADSMQDKWRSHGTLWSVAVTSLPMKFTIPKARTVSDCS